MFRLHTFGWQSQTVVVVTNDKHLKQTSVKHLKHENAHKNIRLHTKARTGHLCSTIYAKQFQHQ